MESGHVGVERAQPLEGTVGVALGPLRPSLQTMNTHNVSSQIASLRKFHRAKTAGVRLLSSVFKRVTFKTLFLSKSLATLLTLDYPDFAARLSQELCCPIHLPQLPAFGKKRLSLPTLEPQPVLHVPPVLLTIHPVVLHDVLQTLGPVPGLFI